MSVLNVIANDLDVFAENDFNIPSGNRETYSLHFEFSEAWSEFTKTIVFYSEKEPDSVYEVLVIDNQVVIPAETLVNDGYLYFGIRGVNDTKVKVSNLVKVKIIEGAPSGTVYPVPPTADVYQQILNAYTSVKTISETADSKADTAVSTATEAKTIAENAKSTAETAQTTVDNHSNNTSNPHGVTKSQVGLGNVTNNKQMPIAGGTFTANVMAYSTNRSGYNLRNIGVKDSSGNDVSTNRLDFRRK